MFMPLVNLSTNPAGSFMAKDDLLTLFFYLRDNQRKKIRKNENTKIDVSLSGVLFHFQDMIELEHRK